MHKSVDMYERCIEIPKNFPVFVILLLQSDIIFWLFVS